MFSWFCGLPVSSFGFESEKVYFGIGVIYVLLNLLHDCALMSYSMRNEEEISQILTVANIKTTAF